MKKVVFLITILVCFFSCNLKKKNNISVTCMILLLLCGISCSKKTYKQDTFGCDIESIKYKVEKITEYEAVYIIKLSKNDSIYYVLTESKINPMKISPLSKNNKECKTDQIKEGNFYDLKLDFFYQNIKKQNYVGSLDIQHYVEFNGSQILIESDKAKYYTTKNLKGLCLISDF